ncbi:MAG: hypothetical protein FWJ68_15030, partial [Planifilum fulgidum]
VIVFSPITDIFSDALWDDNITDAQHSPAAALFIRPNHCYNNESFGEGVDPPNTADGDGK